MNKLPTFTARELIQADIKPPHFVIDEILPTGFVILAAPPKTGKSWMCLSIADAVASGNTFWGYKTESGPVLYLALEDSSYRIKQRLEAIGSTIPKNLHFAIHGADTISGGLIDQLQAWTDENPGAKLIICDTIGRVKNSGKPGQNAYEADTSIFATIQQFAIKQAICFIGVSHFSKLKNNADDPFERITGSMGAFGVADAAWIISGKRGNAQQTLRITGRDIADDSYQITLENCIWKLNGSTAELDQQAKIDAYKQSPVIKTIRTLVKNFGSWEGTARQLINEVWLLQKDCSISTAQEMGTTLKGYKEMLTSIDGIAFSQNPGGKKGRGYRFAPTSTPFI